MTSRFPYLKTNFKKLTTTTTTTTTRPIKTEKHQPTTQPANIVTKPDNNTPTSKKLPNLGKVKGNGQTAHEQRSGASKGAVAVSCVAAAVVVVIVAAIVVVVVSRTQKW